MISFNLRATERAKVRYVWVVAMKTSLGREISVHPSTNDTLVTWFEFLECVTEWSPCNCIGLCPFNFESVANVLSSCLVSVCMMKGRDV